MAILTRPIERCFPNDRFFRNLASCAQQFSEAVAVYDPANGVSASYIQLMRDIVATRRGIYDSQLLDLFDSRGMILEDSMWIGLLAPASYDFIVGCLTILSLGGAIMPITATLLPEEIDNFLEQGHCRVLLVGQDQHDAVVNIRKYQEAASRPPITTVTVTRQKVQGLSHCAQGIAYLDNRLTFPPDRPGLIVFTSGTTGPPKGAVLPRCCLYPGPLCTADTRRVQLVDRPPYWMGGIRNTLIPLLSGHSIEIFKPGSPPSEYWELLRQQRITQVCWGPMVLSKLRQYYQDHLRFLPPADLEPYLQGARAIRKITVTSAMPAGALIEFWEKLLVAPLEIGYAATETGGLVSTQPTVVPAKSSIGRPVPDVEMKLSQGTTGEILVRSPRVMLGYLNDEKATRAAFDENGFLLTGDLAHMEGDEFVFDGRASSDFIQVYSNRVPALDVENALVALPYVAEAAVVAVPDPACSNQLGVLVRLREEAVKLSLDRVRSDLAHTLPAYTLPTKLRVLGRGDVLPRTSTDKVNKREALMKYFQGRASVDVQVCLNPKSGINGRRKAWDWAGLQ